MPHGRARARLLMTKSEWSSSFHHTKTQLGHPPKQSHLADERLDPDSRTPQPGWAQPKPPTCKGTSRTDSPCFKPLTFEVVSSAAVGNWHALAQIQCFHPAVPVLAVIATGSKEAWSHSCLPGRNPAWKPETGPPCGALLSLWRMRYSELWERWEQASRPDIPEISTVSSDTGLQPCSLFVSQNIMAPF